MSNQRVPVAEWARQLSDLVLLAGFTAMATPKQNPIIKALPAVEPEKPAEPSRKKSALSPEVREFMSLPPHIQRQVLDYARNWIDATFEKVN